MSRNSLLPRDPAEAVGLFRASIVGAVVHRELSRGELALALRTIVACKYRPPGSRVTINTVVDDGRDSKPTLKLAAQAIRARDADRRQECIQSIVRRD